MDRRSWLWKRRSSEKIPGETESSGSASSQSERCSDDQVCLRRSSPIMWPVAQFLFVLSLNGTQPSNAGMQHIHILWNDVPEMHVFLS